jgi:uncharacterized protein (TIGR02246 family)
MKRLLIPALLGVQLAAVLPALASDITEADLMQAATDLSHRYDTNYAAKDAAAMAALYATDGILVSPSGAIVRGRDALKDFYVKRFASGARNHAIKVMEVHVQGNGGYGLASFSVSVSDAHGDRHDEQGSLVAVYSRDADGWHIRLAEPSLPPKK